MRTNEYNSIEEFKSEFTRVWAPSDGHWFGLDFIYKGTEYRFHTGSMYETSNTILADGREATFGLYKKLSQKTNGRWYELLSEFATIEDVLASTCIDDRLFSEVIMDDSTELVGQD